MSLELLDLWPLLCAFDIKKTYWAGNRKWDTGIKIGSVAGFGVGCGVEGGMGGGPDSTLSTRLDFKIEVAADPAWLQPSFFHRLPSSFIDAFLLESE